ncbi:MAG TPA: iron uptake system protein EfeO [Jatrophihabitantaceae bacterium]|nr:iron uptake system protein EfeO [Jatrophihabitantaceae bacterium]
MTPRSASLAAVGLAAVAVAALAACSSDKKSDPPPAGSGGDPHKVAVTITAADGCQTDRADYTSGGLTFTITNKDATGVSEVELLSGERIVGEKENLPPGFTGTFALSADPGDYTLYCPGAKTARTPFKVTGTATSTANTDTHALLVQGTKDYGAYVTRQVGYLVTAVKPLATALTKGDLAAAQTAYAKARPYYERIEPVAESFTTGTLQLDPAIDAREGDVPAAKWTGFHYIEKGLFQAKSTAGLAPYGQGLLTNVQKLQTLVKGLTYQPAELANGAVELLDEVSKTKITGEEERYSHIDLLDFQANVEGSEQAFANLQPALAKIDPALAKSVTTAFGNVDTLLDKYRSPTDPSGFVRYGTLTAADKTAAAHAVQAVAEPLSRVASKVVNA